MLTLRQPDGSEVTTPVYAGVGPPKKMLCNNDVSGKSCAWSDKGPAETLNGRTVQFQECSVCGFFRTYTHPRANDGTQETGQNGDSVQGAAE